MSVFIDVDESHFLKCGGYQLRSLLGDYVLQHLQNEQTGTLHYRLFRCLRHAIVKGVVQPSTRLPASRDLAQAIHVSRNTVLSAYDQLQAEGYVEAKTGHGTWVSSRIPDDFLSSLPSHIDNKREKLDEEEKYEISKRGQCLIERASASPHQWGAFVPGVPDVMAFPHHIFQRIQTKQSKLPQIEQLIYSNTGGCFRLRTALAQYLKVSRSVSCDADQIIITEGIHQGIDLITRVLSDVGDLAWVEEPGYWGVKNNLSMNGLDVEPISIDSEGLYIPNSPQRLPSLIFVTPSHQYPLGPHLSIQRRKHLIKFARENKCWVVEDDYDSEFRFSGKPYPSLQGLERNSPVIYMGTFSKTIYPALRIGYVVAPKSLAPILRQASTELYRGGHTLLQNTLAEFIEEGHYEAHIRRMRLLYGKRRSYLIDLIFKYLGERFLHPYDNASGLHLVLKLPQSVDDTALSEYAIQRGVKVRPLSQYYLNRHSTCEKGLLLGFACVDGKNMFDAFTLLIECLKKFNIPLK